jgi:hypothetical protein
MEGTDISEWEEEEKKKKREEVIKHNQSNLKVSN